MSHKERSGTVDLQWVTVQASEAEQERRDWPSSKTVFISEMVHDNRKGKDWQGGRRIGRRRAAACPLPLPLPLPPSPSSSSSSLGPAIGGEGVWRILPSSVLVLVMRYCQSGRLQRCGQGHGCHFGAARHIQALLACLGCHPRAPKPSYKRPSCPGFNVALWMQRARGVPPVRAHPATCRRQGAMAWKSSPCVDEFVPARLASRFLFSFLVFFSLSRPAADVMDQFGSVTGP